MVAFVVVSHSRKLAEGVQDICKMTAPEVIVYPVGGLEDGSFGTDYQCVESAIRSADNPDGVIVLCDIGSSVMTSEMVLENIGSDKARIADCPLVEGAIVGTILASAGADIDKILKELSSVAKQKKMKGNINYEIRNRRTSERR